MSAPDQTPTPWTDERKLMTRQFSYVVEAYDCQVLERHLRRIVEARENLANGGGIAALLSAIKAAKEEIK